MEDHKSLLVSAVMAEAARRQTTLNGGDPSQAGWGSPSRTHGVGVRDPDGAWVKSLGQLVEMLTSAVKVEYPDPGIFLLHLAAGYNVYPARLAVGSIPARYFDGGLVTLQRFEGVQGITIKPVVRDALPNEFQSNVISIKLDVDGGYRMWIAGVDESLLEEESAVIVYRRAAPQPAPQAAPSPRPVYKKYGFGAPSKDLDMPPPEADPRPQHPQPRRRFTPNAPRRAVKK